jgi:AhpD family alkylhydroperoxidase
MASMTEGDRKLGEVRRDVEATLGRVPEWAEHVPDSALAPLWSMMKDFELAETKIPGKYKELIGVAVSGATRCRYCSLFHTEAAKLNGATDEEIAEASMFAGFTMCVSTFLNAQQIDYGKFRDETLKIVDFVRTAQKKAGASASKGSASAHA